MLNNIGCFLSKRAELSPTLEALIEVESGRRFSYRELNARCNRTAHALRALGVKKGDRVALLLMNGAEYVESFFAAAKIGAIVVPLNWRLVPDELAFILGDSGAKLLIFGEEFADAVADLHRRGSAETELRHWLRVDSEDARPRPDWALSYAELQAEASDQEPWVGAADHDELYIMYTSGTTGLPKGAVHTHETSTWAVLTINATADLRHHDRYLLMLPLFHVGALTPLTGSVHRGVTNAILRAFDPGVAWRTIEAERITTMLAVPAMLNFMLQVPEREQVDHSSLRWCMSGAAPVPVSLIEAYGKLGIEIHQVYGLTESCGPACLISPEEALAKAGSTGKAFFHTDVRVVDEQGNRVEPGATGEVLVRGRHVMKGYWQRPEATAEAIRDGWLHTGDVAAIDEDGFIYIQDRIKDMIISGGENVYPAEIENVIVAHPKVSEVGVIGQASDRWGESPVAIVVKSDASLSEQDVLDHCQGKLARFKQPVRVYFADEIPRNPSGKILKRLLRDEYAEAAPE
jgi:O-succinylbenzoate-CoA ligase